MTALLILNAVLMFAIAAAIVGWIAWGIAHEPKVVRRHVRASRQRAVRQRARTGSLPVPA